jgi:uncharacterized glyoxalase superfamily protein PhnB
LLYENGAAAIDFLTNAFGFEEVMRMEDDRGSANHALVDVYVEDVDDHFERAEAAGAEIVIEPTDQEYGDRRYDAKDPERHFWSFATPLAGS